MNIFFLHPSFPAQYLNLAPYLAHNPENTVYFCAKDNSINSQLKGVTLALYGKPTEKEEEYIKNAGPLRPAAEAVVEGQAVVRALQWLDRERNMRPDVIIAHTGWGSTLVILSGTIWQMTAIVTGGLTKCRKLETEFQFVQETRTT